jgi:shikimate dehydrogenase
VTGAKPDSSHVDFIGVSTKLSSIMRIFPLWADALGLPTRRIDGVDIRLDAEPGEYRQVVGRIAADPLDLGALVTTHKIAVAEHAGDLFDEFDELATTFGEISSIAKRGGRLIGSAKDPVTVRLALEEIIAACHFRSTGAEALVLGAGGSGNALGYQLGVRGDTPERITVTDRRESSLKRARELHERGGLDAGRFRYLRTDAPDEVDRLIAELPDSSLVVNATGLGKDRPGSPMTDHVVLPQHAVVWEFNYRGELDFLRQARAQREQRQLRVEDGWRYFIHGWSQVIADVFDIPMPAERVAELSAIAQAVR